MSLKPSMTLHAMLNKLRNGESGMAADINILQAEIQHELRKAFLAGHSREYLVQGEPTDVTANRYAERAVLDYLRDEKP